MKWTPEMDESVRGSWKASWHEVGNQRCFFRSRWEANYARYLEWLCSIGQIAKWEHEPQTFWLRMSHGLRHARKMTSMIPASRPIGRKVMAM